MKGTLVAISWNLIYTPPFHPSTFLWKLREPNRHINHNIYYTSSVPKYKLQIVLYFIPKKLLKLKALIM